MKRVLSMILAVAIVLSLLVFPTSAATYRGTASDSYKSGKYYQYFCNIPLTGDKRTDTIAIALSQMGYQEGATSSNLSGESGGTSNYTEFMRFVYGNQSWAWCAAFCSWSLYQSYASSQNGSNYWYRNHTGESGYHWTEVSCPYWTQALQNDGLWRTSAYYGGNYTPRTGDLIFFYSSGSTIGHVGMVVYTSGSTVYTIEGNTSSGTGVEANGGGVYFKSYSMSSSSIAGYGALDYDSSSDGNDIDYSGAHPTAGLYMTAAYKYLYADAACTTRATYSNGVYVDVPRYTMVEVTGVSSDGNALICTYDGVTGYLSNNSTDRVVQLTSTGSTSGGSSSGGSSSGGSSSGGTTTGGIHQLQGVGTSAAKEYHLGIDVSYYQVGGSNLYYDMIDFAELKDAGCEFVILRAGDTNLSGYIDPSFIGLYQRARAAGMAVGVYYFSRATTYAGSQAEAEWLISVMEANDMYFEYPIYIDIETAAQGALGATAADQLCLGWCETMEKAGYYPGVYSNYNGVFDVITSNVTDYYDLWIASVSTTSSTGNHWSHTSKDYYSSGMSMWQYSWFNLDANQNYVYSKGIYTSPAQTTPVTDLDMDVSYKDYAAIMKTYGYNNCGDGSGNAGTGNRNLVSGMNYSTSGVAGDPYYANLTDGQATSSMDVSTGWCGWNSDGTVTFDLGETYDLSSARIHLMNLLDYSIGSASVKIAVSNDGVNYTTYSEAFPVQSADGVYWAELDFDGIFAGRYVRVSLNRVYCSWIFTNEIEIYGALRNDGGNLALGGNYTTATSGSQHSTEIWQDDQIRLTDGVKSSTNSGSPYSGWVASDVDITVDLGSVKDTGTYCAYAAYGFYGITAPTDLIVSVSTDGVNFTKVDTPATITTVESDSTSMTMVKLTVSSATVSSARYVKFTVKTGGSFLWIDEVEVYGDVSGGAICYDNLLSDKNYTITTGTGAAIGTHYTANLTDGVALPASKIWTDGAWFGFAADNTDDNYGAVVFDLGDVYDLTRARLYLMNQSNAGVEAPSNLRISISDDGKIYTPYTDAFSVQTADGSYWSELTFDGAFSGRYVKFSFELTGSWFFVNEIELYGTLRDEDNLALGGNYTTSSNGSMHPTSTYQDDQIRLTDGVKSPTSAGSSAHSSWNANNVEVIVDLGSVKQTGTYCVYGSFGYWGLKALADVSISVSTDGVSYTEIYAPMVTELVGIGEEVTSSSGAIVNVQRNKYTVSSPELVNARYVKFSITPSNGTVWIDEVEVTADVSGSEKCYENLLSGLDFTSTTGSDVYVKNYYDSLTNGQAMTSAHPYRDGYWYALWRGNATEEGESNIVDGYADMIFDLGGLYQLSDARIHLMNNSASGAYAPESLRLWVSEDGVNYTKYVDFPLQTEDGCYWSELDDMNLAGRYVKITCQLADGKNWVCLNELEVNGTAVDTKSNLALGGSYTTSTDGTKYENVKYQDDELRLIDGSKSNANGESSAYSSWVANNVDVIVDLGSTTATGTYVLYAASNFWGISSPADLTISVSTDGINYTEIDAEAYSVLLGLGNAYTVSDGAVVNNELRAIVVSSDTLTCARYVMFSIEANGSFIWIDEVEVYAVTASDVLPESTGNLANGATYAASSNGSKHALSKFHDDSVRLTDGAKSSEDNISTAYSGWTADQVEIVVDLGSVQTSNTYAVYTASNFWGIQAPANVTVYVSTDGVTYTDLDADTVSAVVGTTASGAQLNSLTVTADDLVNARYIKFVVEGTGNFIWIDEVEVSLVMD